MPRRSFTIEQVLTALAETPPRIAALTAGLAPAQLHAAPSPGEWSSNEVLAHLRACTDLLAVLEPLPREAWSRSATVTGGGSSTRTDRVVLCAVACTS
jgi:hypothetical protein